MIMIAVIVAVFVMAIGAYMIFHKSSSGGNGTTTTTTTTNNTGTTQNKDQQRLQQEQTLFDQANTARDGKQWDDAINKYTQVANMAENSDPLKEQALAAISVVNQKKQGVDDSALQKQTFQKANTAFSKKQYETARGLYQEVMGIKVQDPALGQQAQAKIDEIDKYLSFQSEYQNAENAASHNQLDAAIAQFDKIAGGDGPFAGRAKARSAELQKMKAATVANAELAKAYNDALQAENNNDLNGALDRFKAIVGKGEPFGSEAQDRIKEINQKIAGQNADKEWSAATAAESTDPQGALRQLQAIAGKPGPHQEQAQAEITSLNSKLSTAADQAKFDEASRKLSAGDLSGALTEFKALGSKPGPLQSQASDKAFQVMQQIASAPKPGEPKPVVNQPAPTPTPTTTAARTPTVTPLFGVHETYALPWHKGVIVPDYNVDGGLQPAGTLTVPPMKDAPANSICVVKITVDENGDVTPNQVLQDTSGYGPDVQKAARSWKFNPPKAKGKPVQASVSVRVTF